MNSASTICFIAIAKTTVLRLANRNEESSRFSGRWTISAAETSMYKGFLRNLLMIEACIRGAGEPLHYTPRTFSFSFWLFRRRPGRSMSKSATASWWTR